jgi:hypothetical protein
MEKSRIRDKHAGSATLLMVKPFEPDSLPNSTFQILKIFCTFVNIHKKTTKAKSLNCHDLRILRFKPPKFATSRPTSKFYITVTFQLLKILM